MTTQNPTPASQGAPDTPSSGRNAPARRPNTLRTVLLVVGSIVIVLVLAFAAVRIVRALNNEDTSGIHPISQSFETLELRSSAADVVILRESGVDRTELRFDQGDTNLRLEYAVRGGVLKATVGNDDWGWWGFGNWGDWRSRGALITVVLPADADAIALDLRSTAGDVDVDGDFTDVAVRSTAGNVTLSGSAGELRLDTTAGEAALDDFSVSGSFRSETTAGDMDFDFAELPRSIDVRSTAGTVRVGLPDGRYRIEADSTAGSIRNEVSSYASSDRVYRFTTTAGDIELYTR